jgi:hypothetical protein
MYQGIALQKADIANVMVPAGDRGEQLIANLIWWNIALELHSDAVAKAYLAQAHFLALNIANQSVTYRPPRPSKFAQLTCEIGGTVGTLLLPIIDGTLILPKIESRARDVNRSMGTAVVSITRLEVVYYTLRFRVQRLLGALNSMINMDSGERLADMFRRILAECIRHEIPVQDTLTCANDYLTLARDLVGKGQLHLVGPTLRNAANALDAFMSSTERNDYQHITQTMKHQIQLILAEIRGSTM